MAAGVLSTGATRQRINLQSASARAIALPPQDEQDAILRHLAVVSIPLGSAIAVATREIDLIREYRTRLITDVVTGKVDVRELAAGLPGVEEAEPDDVPLEGELAADDEFEPVEEHAGADE